MRFKDFLPKHRHYSGYKDNDANLDRFLASQKTTSRDGPRLQKFTASSKGAFGPPKD